MSRDMTEQIAGARAKSFLAAALFDLISEFSEDLEDWKKKITQVISSATKNAFSKSGDMTLETQAKVFLRWLGFSPVDVWWSEDVRVGKIFLGTSRLWKGDLADSTNEKLRVLIIAIIKGMGQSFLDGQARVEILKDADLPTRHTLCVQFSEAAVVPKITASRKTKASTATEEITLGIELVEPFLGKAIDAKTGLNALVNASLNWIKEEEEENYRIYENDLKEIPLKALYVSYKIAVDRNRQKEVALKVGDRFIKNIRDHAPDALPHEIIKGLGLLPPEQISELIFYGKNPSMAQEENLPFTIFLTKIFEKFLENILGKRFVAEKPVLAAGSGKLCLFSFSSS